jgi:hypothetical protein
MQYMMLHRYMPDELYSDELAQSECNLLKVPMSSYYGVQPVSSLPVLTASP